VNHLVYVHQSINSLINDLIQKGPSKYKFTKANLTNKFFDAAIDDNSYVPMGSDYDNWIRKEVLEEHLKPGTAFTIKQWANMPDYGNLVKVNNQPYQDEW